MMPILHMASAIFPGFTHPDAVERCQRGVAESIGALSCTHIELCPQHSRPLTEGAAEQLRAAWPETRFRLHANVRVGVPHPRYDASSRGSAVDDYFALLADRHRRLGASVYTLHAGYRAKSTLVQVVDRVRMLSDLFACRVGVEGLYYARGDEYLLSTWTEYRWLYERTDIDYVVDLSHLNILARRERFIDHDLVAAMLADRRCLEVHISTNDGIRDSHRPLNDPSIWWMPYLSLVHPETTVFSEGTQEMLRPASRPTPLQSATDR
jgi:hypothetical protein